MRAKDIIILSCLEVKNRSRTTLKLFILFLIAVFFACSFTLYISLLDNAAYALLNEEQANRELILRNKQILSPLDIDVINIRHPDIVNVEEKYFTPIFEEKTEVVIDGISLSGYCSQLDYTTKKHAVGNENRYLEADEILVGKKFAENLGIKDFDSYIGKELTLILSAKKIFTKKIAGFLDNDLITLSDKSINEIKKNLIVTNWFFIEVDDYKNKESVKNYLSEFENAEVVSAIDNEENLQAISLHRELMLNIFSILSILIFLALIVCVSFIIIIDNVSKKRFNGTLRACGVTAMDYYRVMLFYLIIVYSIAFAFGYLFSIGMIYAAIKLLDSIFLIRFAMTFKSSQIVLLSVYFSGIAIIGNCTLIAGKINSYKTLANLIKEL